MAQELENLVNRSYDSEPKYTEILAGVPEDYKQIKTLRDLLEINYKIIVSILTVIVNYFLHKKEVEVF